MYGVFTFAVEPLGGIDAWGIYWQTAVAAGIHILYALAIFPFLEKRKPILAGFISYLLFAVMAGTLIHLTRGLGVQYLPLWGIVIFLGGMFGGFILMLMSSLTLSYYFLINSDVINGAADFNGIEIIVTILLALLSYVLWRNVRLDTDLPEPGKEFDIIESIKSTTLINSIIDGLIMIDQEGVIKVFNPSAEKILGWSIDEAKGLDYKSVLRFFDDKGREYTGDQNPIAQCFSTSNPARMQTAFSKSKQDKQLELDVMASPIVQENSTSLEAVMVIFRDVSKERNEERQRAEFISTASHEMRTPVAAIEGYLALALNEKVSKIDSNARSYLEKAHTSTKHLGKLFQDLLTAAKSEDGRLSSHPVVIEVGHFLQEITDRLKFTAESKGLNVYYGFGDRLVDTSKVVEGKVIDPILYVYADPDRMREVITNLFDNAVKYTEEGKITISMGHDQGNVIINIADTGPGISKEDATHLFQKFYRIDNSDTRQIGGTGLGLFICKKIVELYGGKIWVESEVGKGSTFKISLPMLPADRAKQMLRSEAQMASPIDPNAPMPEVSFSQPTQPEQPSAPPKE